MFDGASGGNNSKTGTVRGAVDDAIGRLVVRDLFSTESDRGIAGAIDLVFPAVDFCIGEKAAKLADDLGRGNKFGEEVSIASPKFSRSDGFQRAVWKALVDGAESEIGDGGGVENGVEGIF